MIPELPKRDPQRRVVVAVAGHDAASERAQLGLEALEREYLLRRPVRLELVAVDDDEQPADALVRGRLERLPVLPLLELAVARHHHDTPAPAQMPLGPGDPASLGDAHPERPRVRLDSRHADVRMAVEPPEPPEAEEALGRDHAERVERGVQAGDVVPLGREEHVAVRRVEPDLGHVQLLPEKVDDEVE